MSERNGVVYGVVGSPVGGLRLGGVVTGAGVVLDSVEFVEGGELGAVGVFGEVERQLEGYFAGELKQFEVVCTERGTEFQRRVWREVEQVPYGQTVTYGQLAKRVGVGGDRVRAVAAAVGANPLLVVRACHRVVGAGGLLTGYAGGVERKQFLLVHEGALQAQLM